MVDYVSSSTVSSYEAFAQVSFGGQNSIILCFYALKGVETIIIGTRKSVFWGKAIVNRYNGCGYLSC